MMLDVVWICVVEREWSCENPTRRDSCSSGLRYVLTGYNRTSGDGAPANRMLPEYAPLLFGRRYLLMHKILE